MCLAVPGKVIELEGNKATVDFGGVKRDIDVSLVDAGIDEYVIVHTGFAIQILEEKVALETLELWRQMFEAME